jgi:hypothetical protein
MNDVIHFSPRCFKCGMSLLSAAAICACMVRHDDQAHTEQMPLSPPIVTPIVLQTSTGAWDGQFHRYVISKR